MGPQELVPRNSPSQKRHRGKDATGNTAHDRNGPRPRAISLLFIIRVARLLRIIVVRGLRSRVRVGGGPRGGGLLAHDLVGDVDAGAGADGLGEGHGLVLALLVALVLEAAGDVVEEFVVAADALDVALVAAGDLVAEGGGVDAAVLCGGEGGGWLASCVLWRWLMGGVAGTAGGPGGAGAHSASGDVGGRLSQDGRREGQDGGCVLHCEARCLGSV